MPETHGTLTKVLPKATGYYSLMIGDEWYGGGKSAPDAAEGDRVEVTYTEKNVNGKIYRNATSVRAAPKNATVARSAKEAVAVTVGLDKDLYWKTKEKRDVINDGKRELGATRNTAVEIVNFAIDKGFLPSLDKAKVQDKFDLYLSIIEGTAHKLMDSGKAPTPKATKLVVEDTSEEMEQDND